MEAAKSVVQALPSKVLWYFNTRTLMTLVS